jgi:perosamine synthetase
MIPVNRPLISKSDVDFVSNELEAGFISGEIPLIGELEKEFSKYLGVAASVAVSNGTVALDLLVNAFDIKAGDVCVVPSFTIISTINELVRRRAKLVFVDSEPGTWNMNTAEAISVINSSTKAVFPVHIYGLPVDMDPILNAVAGTSTKIIEDAAEALGVEYKGQKVGSLGDASMFSFYANKIITGGEGGMISTSDSSIAGQLRLDRTLNFRIGERFVSDELGWNSRIHGLSAALIYSQLKRLDSLVEAKKNIASRYLEGLAGHPWFTYQSGRTNYSENTYWVFGLLLNDDAPYDAESFQKLLREKGIESRRFFCPMHLQPVLKDYDFKISSNMHMSEKLWRSGVYIPSGLGTTETEQETIISTLWSLT